MFLKKKQHIFVKKYGDFMRMGKNDMVENFCFDKFGFKIHRGCQE